MNSTTVQQSEQRPETRPETRQETRQEQRLELTGIDGKALVASTWGDPEAPTALFLHGGGQTRHAWSGAASVVANSGWYGVAMDLRGHGDSAWYEDGDYNGQRMPEELISVYQQLRQRNDGRPLVVIGASMGGLLSLVASYLQPGCMDALVLVDIAPKMEPEGVQRIMQFMRAHPDGFTSLEQAAEHVASYLPHRPKPDNHDGLKKNLRQHANGRWYWHWDPALFSAAGEVKAVGDSESFDRAARALNIPTLLIRGRMSDVVSEAGVAHFLELAPHAQYVDLQGAAHMVAGDANDAFNDSVSRFLDAFSQATSLA